MDLRSLRGPSRSIGSSTRRTTAVLFGVALVAFALIAGVAAAQPIVARGALRLAPTGASASETSASVDTTAPGPATGLGGVARYRGAKLTWANPGDDYAATRILRSTAGYATTATVVAGQSNVFEGAGTTFVNTSLNSGQRYYYTVFERDAAGNWSTPARVSVVPQSHATLGTPSIKPTAPTHNKTFQITGTISPKHSSAATVTLYIYQKVHGAYILYGTVAVTMKAHAGSYSKSLKLSAKGGYSVKAYHADSAHAGRYSVTRTFTVK